MPTVILLDVSLSMSRIVPISDSTEEWQRRHLAFRGISLLLDQITAGNKMEFVSLVSKHPKIGVTNALFRDTVTLQD